VLAAATLVFGSDAAGQAGPTRDPMVPPAAAQASAARPLPDVAPVAPAALRQILVVDGRRYVIEGVRRRGVGELLGGARIERIDDDAVWLRQAGSLQRVPLFGSVTKKAALESAPPALAALAARSGPTSLARASTPAPKP
jgi:hypothetical protein